MPKIILVICTVIFLYSCNAQQFKDAPIKYTPNMMNEIYKQVKTYPEHPYYSITFAHKGCAIEIWLNNMPQFISLDTMGIVTLPINTEILDSGKQKLLIKIYLPFNTKELLKGENVSLEAKVEMNNERNDITTYKVIEFKPKKVFNNKGKEVFDFEGKEIMEYTLEFNAAVPYKLKGWRNSKDLRKLPGIEQKVKAYYAHFREKFAANDSVYFANVMYKKEFEMAQSLYMSGSEESTKRWKDLLEAINDKKKYEGGGLKLNEFQLEFYGDGKVVGLVYKGYQAYNARGIGYIKKVKNENGKEYDDFFTFPLYLHMPEGSTELEIIR